MPFDTPRRYILISDGPRRVDETRGVIDKTVHRSAERSGVPLGDASGGSARVRLWLLLIIAAIVARFALAAVSFGSNDAAAWRNFAELISQDGLLHTYQTLGEFNHPPLPGYWAAAALALAGRSGTVWADAIFTNIFKIPAILADCLGIYLLQRIWRQRGSGRKAMAVAAMFAWNIDAIFVSAYHCNTDSIYVALSLLSLYLTEERGSDFWGGFALGAAINVKIIPALLIPAMLVNYRERGRLAKFVAGLIVWVIPFIPPLVLIGKPFVTHIFAYNSLLDRWGINFFLLFGPRVYFEGHSRAQRLAIWYYFHGKYVIIAAVIAWAVLARLLKRWNRYELAAVTFILFLILTPGFGVQYTVLPGLLVFAIRPMMGAIYGLLAGVFVVAAYWFNWTGTWPAMSQWTTLLPLHVAFLGLVVWLALIWIMVQIWISPARALDRRIIAEPHQI